LPIVKAALLINCNKDVVINVPRVSVFCRTIGKRSGLGRSQNTPRSWSEKMFPGDLRECLHQPLRLKIGYRAYFLSKELTL
jgi:hypothetical protein